MPRHAAVMPAHQSKPAVERPHKGLTAIQEELADLASQIILYGGLRQDVELFLTALIRHQYRHRSFVLAEHAEIVAIRQQDIVRWVASAYAELRKDWPATRGAPATVEQPVASTVAELVRANVRDSLRDQFERFLTDENGIESAWLLNEILQYVESGDDLTKAIYHAMDRAHIYIRVPNIYAKQVREYLELLEGKEVEQ